MPPPRQVEDPAAVMWNVEPGGATPARRIETVVPQDFAGATTRIGCRRHGTWHAATGRLLAGYAEFPFDVLRAPIAEARRAGKTIDLPWTPW